MKALIVNENANGKKTAQVTDIDPDTLPNGDVTVNVHYSTLNYKDGLCLGSGGGLVKSYPHIPGIDFSGVVKESHNERYKPGDKVLLTGWRVGEMHWGGYAEKARVKADWLVPIPDPLTPYQAMVMGTAGFTAALAVQTLETFGLHSSQGNVLVTGAAGGVGSVAIALLAANGYNVAAVTGRGSEANALTALGAHKIIPRTDLSEISKRPLEAETWGGCIDAVGGAMLARILGQMHYGSSVAAVGLAGGTAIPASVIPFLLRGIRLIGIDSVMQPFSMRQTIWDRIAREFPFARFEPMVKTVDLNDVPALAQDILKGAIKGRIVVRINPS